MRGALVPTDQTWGLRVESGVALLARIESADPPVLATRPETLVRPVAQVESEVGMTLPAGFQFDAAEGVTPVASRFYAVRIRGVIDSRAIDSGYALAYDREPLAVTHHLRGPSEILGEPGGESFASIDAETWDVAVHEQQDSWALVTIARGTCADFRVDGWVPADALEPMTFFMDSSSWPNGIDPFADTVEAKVGDWLVADTGGRVGLVVEQQTMDCTECSDADPVAAVTVHLLGEDMPLHLLRGDTESRKLAHEVRDPLACRRPIVPAVGIPVRRYK